ncbi:hypothetical protein GCM10017771_12240 [Streptomyces capitiformicae]|uniref:Uncharacterized protein n=1 Tax=Streptomyces capitiformicae TaxID=2014920 RepID=A0A919GG25_9ACTN|nr:hypothetical protein GCM10017771_12240 [Streptomyces capitiformicae]
MGPILAYAPTLLRPFQTPTVTAGQGSGTRPMASWDAVFLAVGGNGGSQWFQRADGEDGGSGA